MGRFRLLPAAIYLLLETVHGQFEDLHFSSELDEFACPDFGFSCNPPEICAKHRLLDKYYCCMPGAGGICWTGSATCEGQGGLQPSSSQIGCNTGENAFCCLATREECTQKSSQINICWATPENPVANISIDDMTNVYSSLLSESPSATAYPVDLESLLPDTSSPTPNPTTSSTTLPTVTSQQQSPSPTDLTGGPLSNPSPSPSSTPLTAGAIAGIVVGSATGLALLGAAVFFLLRRKRRTANELDGNPYAGRDDVDGVGGVQEKYAHYVAEPVEVAAERERAELLSPRVVHELQAEAVERGELEGSGSEAGSGTVTERGKG